MHGFNIFPKNFVIRYSLFVNSKLVNSKPIHSQLANPFYTSTFA